MEYLIVNVLPIVIQVAIVLVCITIHEVSHGRAARLLGDPTAEAMGRLSFNPLRHIDPFGTIMLPFLLAISGLPPFGYAKPVPVDPRYFRDHRVGMFLTGMAGPASNLVAAGVGAVAFRALGLSTNQIGGSLGLGGSLLVYGLLMFVEINVVLAVFNMLPIPPMDGSRVLPLFLSDKGMYYYRQFERYGILIVFLIILIPRLHDLVFGAIFAVINPIITFLVGQGARF